MSARREQLAERIRNQFSGLVYSAPRADALSQKDVALIAAHFWDAIRAEVLREAADAIGTFADAAEQDAIAYSGEAYGRSNRTVAAYRETEELVRRLANDPKEHS